MRKHINATQIIFLIYCLILAWLVLFKMAFSFYDIPWFAGERNVNFIPFYYDKDVGSFHAREVILNVLIFIPFGVYLKMLDLPWKKVVLIGALCSLAFEALQLAFAIGASDITDIITNTLGTFFGVLIYALMRKIFQSKKITDRIINILAANLLGLFLSLTALLFAFNR